MKPGRLRSCRASTICGVCESLCELVSELLSRVPRTHLRTWGHRSAGVLGRWNSTTRAACPRRPADSTARDCLHVGPRPTGAERVFAVWVSEPAGMIQEHYVVSLVDMVRPRWSVARCNDSTHNRGIPRA
jgi:hypothetical protein